MALVPNEPRSYKKSNGSQDARRGSGAPMRQQKPSLSQEGHETPITSYKEGQLGPP